MMKQHEHRYELYARLLEYPTWEYLKNLSMLLEHTEVNEASRLEMHAFARVLEPLSLTDIEELYTRTFDINPVASLEVGWHLYGEQYERGSFLVQMRDRLANRSIPEGTELPDHIGSVLRFCATEEQYAAGDFIAMYVLPALRIIHDGLAEKENPYSHVVGALRVSLEEDCPQLHGEKQHV